MSASRIIQYIHRPTLTELGMGNTHDRYLVVDSDKDLSDVFPLGVGVNLTDTVSNKVYQVYSKVETGEFRLKRLGDIVDDYHMEPGDEIVITHYELSGNVLDMLTVNECGRVLLNPGKRKDGKIEDFEIVNIERLPGYSENMEYSYACECYGSKKDIQISFIGSRKKRSDSPIETKFYSVQFGKERLDYDPKKYYYLTIRDGVIVLKNLPKSEYRVLLESSDTNGMVNKPNKNDLQVIYYGAPGTGKSHTIKCEVDDKGMPCERTTFHPDSDYSTFVGAYKPTTVDETVMTVIGTKAVPVENPDGQPRIESKIVYEFVPQAFLKAYTGAWKDQSKDFYLIIEEINRGNCAQIFGDLFQLLDRNDETGRSKYPISPDQDIKKFLLTDKKYGFATLMDEQKAAMPEEVLSGERLVLPQNLHIWATMNTSDQSLFPIDSAFKRRWDWQYTPISDGKQGWKVEVNGMYYDWWDFLQKINEQIGSTTNSEDKKLGYYFCKAKNGIINAETFVGKVIFYIWNDVFKDFAEEAGDLFKDVDGSLLSFNKFYTVSGDRKTMVVEEKVMLLLQNLGVMPIGQVEEKEIANGELEEISDSISSNGHKSIRSVVFPDGKVISTDNMTHFEVYLESLKKIGIETVYPVIAKMKYQRKGCPLISTEKLPDIINSNEYSYYQEGQYFIVKGASDDTLINILNDLNSKLDLGIIVNYE